MQRIAVIGAGIAGLTVALRRANAGDQVVLFEAAAQVGGQLASEERSGLVIEHGAEGFVARSEAVPALAVEAGIVDHVVEQLVQRSFRFDGSQLVELAPGEAGRLLGFQVPSDELGRGIRSFWHGMAELPERLASTLGSRVELRLNSAVARATPRLAGVSLSLEAQENKLDFDGAVIATTARSAAALLSDAFGAPARALQDSSLLSSLTVNLAYRREAIAHPLDGTGFIVPDPEQLDGVRAVTFSSSKLPHRAPASHALLRLFFRPTEHDLRVLSDAAWAERAARALGRALPVSGAAEHAVVSRWPNALPVFDPPHRARIAALETVLAGQRLWLAGAAFHGSGIDAAIRSAESAASAIGGRP
ncbi:MAG: FAD-dependent oxidoreductase [Polyangiaceae bacterium]